MFQQICHSQVNQTRVGGKGVLSLNTLLVAGEFAAQDVRTSKKWMVRQSYMNVVRG